MLCQATNKYFLCHEALQTLDRSLRCSTQWYVLEQSELGVGLFRPGIVSVRVFSGQTDFWHRPRQRHARPRARHGPAPGPVGDAHGADPDVGDGGDEDEAPGGPGHQPLVDEAANGEEVDGEEEAGCSVELSHLLDMCRVAMVEQLNQHLPEDVYEEDAEPEEQEEPLAAEAEPDLAPTMPPPQAGPSAEVPLPPSPSGVASTEPPPPPSEPPASIAASRQAGPRSKAAATVHIHEGRISYYPSKKSFEAVCGNADHGKCVLTRRNTASAAGSRSAPRGGRPLGFLCAWLSESHQPDKAAHWNFHALESLGHEDRLVHRTMLWAAEGGPELVSFERDLAAGEAEEPLTLDGYLKG